MKRKNVAGMSLSGGRKGNFFFCLLEHFVEDDRWFLTALNQVKDEVSSDGNMATLSWISNYNLKELVLDYPLSEPACDNCQLECPGVDKCIDPHIIEVRKHLDEILQADRQSHQSNPKKYEQDRLKDDQFEYGKDILGKESHNYIISKSFRNRLKKGILPYWNRPFDFFVWKYYHDQLMSLFKISYDSFGNVSLMLVNRLKYLRRHFPSDLQLFECDVHLCLIELLRAKVVDKRHLLRLSDIEEGAKSRLEIIKSIEKKLKIFIYDQDLEMIYKNPKAFDSFLLAVAGQCLIMKNVREIPSWAAFDRDNILIPHF